MGRQSLPKAGKLKNGSSSMQFRNRVEQKTMIKLLKSTTSGIWKARTGNVQRLVFIMNLLTLLCLLSCVHVIWHCDKINVAGKIPKNWKGRGESNPKFPECRKEKTHSSLHSIIALVINQKKFGFPKIHFLSYWFLHLCPHPHPTLHFQAIHQENKKKHVVTQKSSSP